MGGEASYNVEMAKAVSDEISRLTPNRVLGTVAPPIHKNLSFPSPAATDVCSLNFARVIHLP